MPFKKDDVKQLMLKEMPLPRCNCGNLASACAAGECWTCQAKRYEAQR